MELEERIINIVEYDFEEMQTGDILIGRRFSGDSAEWMLLSGGHANHAAMVIESNNSMYSKFVIDCPSDLGFINGRGTTRIMTLGEWLGEAFHEGFEVAWLPLDKDLRTFGDLD